MQILALMREDSAPHAAVQHIRWQRCSWSLAGVARVEHKLEPICVQMDGLKWLPRCAAHTGHLQMWPSASWEPLAQSQLPSCTAAGGTILWKLWVWQVGSMSLQSWSWKMLVDTLCPQEAL